MAPTANVGGAATREVEEQGRSRKRTIAQVDPASRGFSRNHRQKTTTRVMKLERMLKLATNDRDTLNGRLCYALRLRRVAAGLDLNDAMQVMTEQYYLVVKLADALLHTAYFPLQQLFFMTLSSLLCALHNTDGEEASAALRRFKDSFKQLDSILLDILPMDETIEATNATLARKQVNVLNRRSNLCRAFNVRKCWISSGGKDKLMPINVDDWMDFGDSTATFYHQLPRETILYNIPYSCIDNLEFDETNCVAYIFSKRMLNLNGITLAVFAVEPADFVAFKGVLSMIKPDSITVKPAPKPRLTDRQNRSQGVAGTPKSVFPSLPTKTQQFSPEEPVRRTLFSPEESIQRTLLQFDFSDEGVLTSPTESSKRDTAKHSATRHPWKAIAGKSLQHVKEKNGDTGLDLWDPTAAVSDDERAMQSSRPLAPSVGDDIQETFMTRLENIEEQLVSGSTAVFQASTKKLLTSTSALTNALINVSSSHLIWNYELRQRVYRVQSSCNELQEQRLLHLPSTELAMEENLAKMKAECIQNLKESMGCVEESIQVQEEPRQYCVAALVMGLLIVVPWALRLALSGMEESSIPPALHRSMETTSTRMGDFSR